MAISKTVPDPFSTTTTTVYIRLVRSSLNHAEMNGRMEFAAYQDLASRNAGKPPLYLISYEITPSGTPAEIDARGNVTRPAIPSYGAIIMANMALYDAEKSAIYTLFGAQPELAGGTEV